MAARLAPRAGGSRRGSLLACGLPAAAAVGVFGGCRCWSAPGAAGSAGAGAQQLQVAAPRALAAPHAAGLASSSAPDSGRRHYAALPLAAVAFATCAAASLRARGGVARRAAAAAAVPAEEAPKGGIFTIFSVIWAVLSALPDIFKAPPQEATGKDAPGLARLGPGGVQSALRGCEIVSVNGGAKKDASELAAGPAPWDVFGKHAAHVRPHGGALPLAVSQPRPSQMGIPAAPAAPTVVQGLAPPMVFQEAVKVAQKKAAQPAHVTAVLGFSAGALIGVGALLMSAVGGASPELFKQDPGLDAFLKGAVGLPAGLTLVVLTGAELFTSNVFTMLAGVMTGAVKPLALVSNWVLSYFTNLLGAVAIAWLSHEAHTMVTPPQVAAAKGIAMFKVGLPFGAAVAKGVLCNWLVCLAVWGALASPSISGKILAIFWPISTFVALGFEHCVANMFLIPQGKFAGAEITPFDFIINNLAPVTLGNIIGGALFVTGIHYLAFHDKAAEELPTEDGSEDGYSSA